MSAVEIRGLRRSFGDHVVLDGIDLDVAEGTVFALLGANGAGKTTMVQILTTLIAADAGSVRVGGHDVASDPDGVRRVIGVTGQFAAVDNLLTGAENLRLMADLHRLGRLDLGMTLVGDPRIMFLDEPTTGLDPRSRRTMWQIVRDVVAGGVTVFLTTQYLDEADELADQIALLDDGRLIAQGTADELKRRVPGERVTLDDVFLTLTK